MVTINLDAQLSGHVFSFLLVFTRLGAALMLFPGLGEAFVPARVRLLMALFISFLLLPVLMPQLPALPASIPGLVKLVAIEALIGLYIGLLLRLLIMAVETAGAIVGVQTGLSNAMILNPALASQNPLPSAFLGTAGVTLLFITGLDHLLLRGLVNTYGLFPIGAPLLTGDMSEAYVRMVNKSFLVGIELAAPFLIGGLLLYVALGFMQRLVAQVQLFLVLIPVQICGGLFLFAVTLGSMMSAWLRFFDSSLTGLLVR
ncbi:MAG: flagellar biosynthetic protein FliR [Alphaproteobacteria bacterium]|nr:flagellar biosynthetic protein FliR [Alphaproteobacteria bacterium]